MFTSRQQGYAIAASCIGARSYERITVVDVLGVAVAETV